MMEKEGKTRDLRLYRVHFRYRPKRYYSMPHSSGYPSAEFGMPCTQPGENRLVVREPQD